MSRAIRTPARWVQQRVARLVAVALGFFRVHADESMTRLVMFGCYLVGAAVGLTAREIARLHPESAAAADMVQSLAILSGAFILNGCVAIASRSRPKGAASADAEAEG